VAIKTLSVISQTIQYQRIQAIVAFIFMVLSHLALFVTFDSISRQYLEWQPKFEHIILTKNEARKYEISSLRIVE
jgi:hypothetical protein